MYGRIYQRIKRQRVSFLALLFLFSLVSILVVTTIVANTFRPAPKLTSMPELVPAWNYTFGENEIASSPVNFKNMVYLSSLHKIDAIEATSGVKRWSFTSSNRQLSSPTAANGIVYVSSSDTIYALDAASGVEKWSFATTNDCSSPIIVNGVLYTVNTVTHILYALDAVSGAVRWQITKNTSCSQLTVANGVIYSFSDSENGKTLDALNTSSGKKLWSYSIRTDTISSPIFANGMVYIKLNYIFPHYTGIFMILDAINAKTGEKQWSFTTEGDLTTPIVTQGTIYIGSSEADPLKGNGSLSLYALSAVTGNTLWSYHVRSHVSQESEFSDPSYYGPFTPLTTVNGVVYADLLAPSPDRDETLYAFNATSGNPLWSSHIGVGDPVSSLVITNGVGYVSTIHRSKLYVLNVQSGAQLSSYLMAGALSSVPVVVINKSAYFTTATSLYAFTITLKETLSPLPTATKTTLFSPTRSPLPAPVPGMETPLYADASGLHIQSTHNMQCSQTLALASDHLTYSKDELQQMRDYVNQFILDDATSTIPPPTLRWVSGSDYCTLSLEISNIGDTPIQIRSAGVLLLSTPSSNNDLHVHMVDSCTLVGDLGCGGRGSGGGGCSLFEINIALNGNAVPTSSFTQPLGGGDSFCFQPTLHPNDTIDVTIHLTSPGKTPNSTAAYTYAVQPVITTADAHGSHILSLTSMATQAVFLDSHQFSCYLLQNATFAPSKGQPCFNIEWEDTSWIWIGRD